MSNPNAQVKVNLIIPNVELKPSDVHGYGVFAKRKYAENEVIEECIGIVFDRNKISDKNILDRSFYMGECASLLPLGYGTIYNHSDNPNAEFFLNPVTKTIRITAIKPIDQDKEIFVYYGDAYFKTRNLKPINPGQKKAKIRLLRPIVIFSLALLCSYLMSLYSHNKASELQMTSTSMQIRGK